MLSSDGARRHRRAPALAALLVATVLAGAVRAAPNAADRETARSLMAEGRELLARMDLKGALDRFQRADTIMHVPTTGYQLAQVQADLGLLVEARDTLARVRETPEAPNDPVPFREARKRAEALDEKIAGRVPGLTIVVQGASPGSSPAVTIDDVPVPPAALGVPRRVDPGHHVIVAKSDGAEGRQEADVGVGETREITVVLASGAPNGAPAPESIESSTPPAPPRSHTLTYVALGVGAVGVAGVAVGVVTGVLTLSKKSALEKECNAAGQCPPPAFGDVNSINTTSTISTIAFVAGGICLGAGITGVVIGTRKRASDESSHAEVRPWVGPGGAGVSGRF
jgi:hypothetical protein